jgi:hypothetical protein
MCYIITQDEREQIKKTKADQFKGYIFFDYECMNVDGKHIPILVIAEKICLVCLREWKTLVNGNRSLKCKTSDCGRSYYYDNNSFCRWLLQQRHFICLAHNLKAYDGIFIMNFLANDPNPTDRYVTRDHIM